MPLLLRVVLLYAATGIIPASNLYGEHQLKPAAVETYSQIASAQLPDASELRQLSGQPRRLNIERLGIDLEVRDGTYDPAIDSWSLSDDAVHFVTATAAPNDSRGNTFLYGHNTQPILEKTINISVGDRAVIQTDNGLSFVYEYRGDSTVAPNQTEVLNDSPDSPRLTLMTCSGWWSETRRLMYFNFIGVVQ